MKRIIFFLSLILGLVACADDDAFSAATGMQLDFPVDTVKLDTVFSRTSSSTYSFWVHNRNSSGVKLQSVRLKRGNQTGFRVNVDGIYLDNTNGAQTNDIEIRKNDSILVFVEITPYETYRTEPEPITDQLMFLLESGVEQHVCLQAWAWDAIKCYSPVIERDSVIESDKPLVVYGDFVIKEGAHLTIRNTTLYFHADAGLEVYGTLLTDHCTMRGDRLDRMFSYLLYDRVPGQWRGVRFCETSNGNVLNDTQIRNSCQGVVCDSAALDANSYRLKLKNCIIHNCQGDGVNLTNAHVSLENCQLSNTMGDCLKVNGGIVEIVYCTLAQFYPFTGGRGAALRFSNTPAPLIDLKCENSILTGYDDDVLIGNQSSADDTFNYLFSHSLLRTPALAADTVHFRDVIWESPKDSIEGKQHFVKIDESNLDYDFHLDSLSTAVGLGCYR
ncbi:right-handed parallel beta-helix repeat-containing protein [Prevotella sp. P6B4]|uniref:right-handed parallel beta-helix repeat-containing protein n=1 Tax=Prevotella sp. P6B4 TaxID=1410614 RepID=UPI000686DAC7|nr:right-handed parallel beta-helix repeat-containing protein [Prevotella sp. P6B4]